MTKIYLLISFLSFISSCFAENILIQPAAINYNSYESLIQNKRVAVFANNASQVNGKNIVEFLLNHNIKIVKIFSPEHGFDGVSDAGVTVKNNSVHNIPIISLYGKKDKPSPQDLSDIDVILFDIQDVGVRYYTYISSLQKIMEAATINNKPLIILDRPNPNANYIDGPILESDLHSFVGMQPIPIVYGMTIGEYAQMLQGEHWLELTPKSKSQQLKLTIIPLIDYNHNSYYKLPVKPSPNLPNMNSIIWYPSLGWFEGTKLSIGRGTKTPFQLLGTNQINPTEFSFIPQSMVGALNPPLKGKICYGWNLIMSESEAITRTNKKIQLGLLINSYKEFKDKPNFFTPFFDKLSGNHTLRQQIINNVSESEIRRSWESGIENFKQIRTKYLIYPDNNIQ